MKKIFKLFCAVALISAVAASCSPEEPKVELNQNGTVVLTAGFPGETTRTTIDENFAPLWATGDLLWVSDGVSLVSAAVSEADNGSSSASFEFVGLMENADEYVGVYNGGGSVVAAGAGQFTCTLENDGSWGTTHVAVGKANKGNVRLYNLSTAISFQVADENIKSVTLSGLIEDDEFPTVATVNMADTTLTNVDVATEFTAKVAAPGTYYFGFFPVEGISGLKLLLAYNDETVKEVVIESPFSFKANNVLELGLVENHVGKTYKVASISTFTAVSGEIAEGFTYTSYKGDASTAPAINNGVIRLYQPASGKTYGGYIEITSVGGDKIAGLHVSVSNNTTIGVTIDDATLVVEDSIAVKWNQGINLSGLNCDKVTLWSLHPNSNNRLYIKAIDVTYLPDARTPQTLSFPEASYTALIGQAFQAPVLSGAQTTVTYTSSNTAVATVDEATGAVTPVAAGTATITATAAENETYKKGSASYSLTVAEASVGVAGIKAAIDKTTSTPFVATLSNAIVTLVQTVYPYTVYIEEDGAGLYVFNAFDNQASTLKVGDKISGTVSGAGVRYNVATLEVTSLDLSAATITPDQTLPLTTVTVAQLKANYADYEFRRVKVEDAVVADALSTSDRNGAIAQDTDTIAIYAQVANTLAIDKGTTVDLIAWPTYYYNSTEQTTTNQLGVWAQGDIIAKGGEGVITMAETKNMNVGATWTVGATCNSGATITYSSNNEAVATVDPATGLVTAVAAGEATITASAPAANNYTAAEATCVVTVSSGDDATVLSFDFSENIAGWVVGKTNAAAGTYNYTLDSVAYPFILSKNGAGIYCNNGYLMLNKNETLGLPTVTGKKLTKVVATSSTTCSVSVKVAVQTSAGVDVTGGTAQTWSNKGVDYTYELSGTANDTVYQLAITNANCQITKVVLTFE